MARQAYDRTLGAASDREWGQLDAIVALVLAAAAAEAFINEFAELVRQSSASQSWSEWPGTAPALGSFARRVLAAETERSSVVGKFSVALESLTGRPADKGTRLFNDVNLLFRARDGLMHRKLEVQPAPPGSIHSTLFDVVKAIESRHITAIEPVLPEGALDQLSTRGVARWACNSAASIVQEVLTSLPEEERPRLASELGDFGRDFVTID